MVPQLRLRCGISCYLATTAPLNLRHNLLFWYRGSACSAAQVAILQPQLRLLSGISCYSGTTAPLNLWQTCYSGTRAQLALRHKLLFWYHSSACFTAQDAILLPQLRFLCGISCYYATTAPHALRHKLLFCHHSFACSAA